MIDTIDFNGLEAFELKDDAVRLTVIPAWGGKVAEIFDRRRGREWLFENSAVSYEDCAAHLPAYGADYVGRFDIGGFDECFPTVGSCFYPSEPWQGTPLPDHGEVWSIRWEAEVDGDALRLMTHGVRLPYRLQKSIRLIGDGGIRFDYQAWNLTSFPMSFLWSSHPLFAVSPGMRISLPVSTLRVDSAVSFSAHHGDLITWPQHGTLDLSRVPEPDAGIAMKLFSPPLGGGWAELSDSSDGAVFRFEFDPTLVTHLGLWINYGGWAGVPDAVPYFNLGLEPCIGAPDTLDTAVNHWRTHRQLPPNGSLSWWLQMILA